MSIIQPIYYIFSKGLVRQTLMQGSILLLTSLLFYPSLVNYKKVYFGKDLEMCRLNLIIVLLVIKLATIPTRFQKAYLATPTTNQDIFIYAFIFIKQVTISENG